MPARRCGRHCATIHQGCPTARGRMPLGEPWPAIPTTATRPRRRWRVRWRRSRTGAPGSTRWTHILGLRRSREPKPRTSSAGRRRSRARGRNSPRATCWRSSARRARASRASCARGSSQPRRRDGPISCARRATPRSWLSARRSCRRSPMTPTRCVRCCASRTPTWRSGCFAAGERSTRRCSSSSISSRSCSR